MIIITFYSPSCFGLETAKGLSVFESSCRLTTCLAQYIQGLREGGAGGIMTSGPMEFSGPIQMTLRSERPIEVACEQLDFGWKNRWNFGEDLFFWDHLILPRKTVEISEKTFFLFEITSFFGPNSSIFSVYFGLYKATIPSHLSWPRAHVWLSAPLSIS